MSDEATLRTRVHDAIRDYCDALHRYEFDASAPGVKLHEPTFGAEEISAAVDCMLSTQVTMGPKVRSFERAFADYGGWGHGVMNNSGSSANLLAVAALANPAMEGHLAPGDEVIVPALSWSTTVWPLIQCNLVPVIVDIDPETLNIDPQQIEEAIGPRTRGLMPVHVYGNPCDMRALQDICERHDLVMIEDCCEALGARYHDTPVGKFGRIGTFSFYFSHHMTTFEGGICITDSTEAAEMMRILRAHGWVREVDDKAAWTDKYPDIDERFLFVNVGYNLRATEMQGAVGLVQLPKLDGYVERRRANASLLWDGLGQFGDLFEFQKETEGGFHSYFGFPMKVSADAPFNVTELRNFLTEHNIESRPIICGNIALQPAMDLYEHRTHGELTQATEVMRRGFSFGNHHAMDEEACGYIVDRIAEFVSGRA